jgi:hypothetical protein
MNCQAPEGGFPAFRSSRFLVFVAKVAFVRREDWDAGSESRAQCGFLN